MPNFKNNKGFKMKGFKMHGKPTKKSPFYIEDPISLPERQLESLPQDAMEPVIQRRAEEPAVTKSEKEIRRENREYEREGRKRNRQMKREGRKMKRDKLMNTKILGGDTTVGDIGKGALDSAANMLVDPSNTDLGVGLEGYGSAINNIKNLKFLQGIKDIYNTTDQLRQRRKTRRGE